MTGHQLIRLGSGRVLSWFAGCASLLLACSIGCIEPTVRGPIGEPVGDDVVSQLSGAWVDCKSNLHLFQIGDRASTLSAALIERENGPRRFQAENFELQLRRQGERLLGFLKVGERDEFMVLLIDVQGAKQASVRPMSASQYSKIARDVDDMLESRDIEKELIRNDAISKAITSAISSKQGLDSLFPVGEERQLTKVMEWQDREKKILRDSDD